MGKKRRRSQWIDETPPEGCHHFQSVGELDHDLQKYFAQRYSIFSRYDDGIWMTEDAWFGVTPEPVAKQIAEHLTQADSSRNAILVDAFAGVGGNVIAFALTGRFRAIYAIEKDRAALACAKHNSEIYEVSHLITWLEGDCFEVLLEQLYGLEDNIILFASPPWGGPGYRSDVVFDLSQMQPYKLDDMMRAFNKITTKIAFYLPRTSDIRQLAAWQEQGQLFVMHYCVRGASKAMCAYFGSLSSEIADSMIDK